MKALAVLLLLACASRCFAACDIRIGLSACSNRQGAAATTGNVPTVYLINGVSTGGMSQSGWTAGSTAIVNSAQPMQTTVMGAPQAGASTGLTQAQPVGFLPDTAPKVKPANRSDDRKIVRVLTLVRPLLLLLGVL